MLPHSVAQRAQPHSKPKCVSRCALRSAVGRLVSTYERQSSSPLRMGRNARTTRQPGFSKRGWNRRLRRRIARAPKAVAGCPEGRPRPLGASSSPEPPGSPWGCATAELGPCQGGRDIWPCWAAACVEAPVRVGVAAVVEHRHRRAQSHAHLRAQVRGRPRRGGRPPARLGLGRAAVTLVRHVFVQSEGVAVDLGEGIYGSGWEGSGRSGRNPHVTAATRHTPSHRHPTGLQAPTNEGAPRAQRLHTRHGGHPTGGGA